MVKLWRDWSISHCMVHLVVQLTNTLDTDNIDHDREIHTRSNRECIHHNFRNESYRSDLFHKSCRKIHGQRHVTDSVQFPLKKKLWRTLPEDVDKDTGVHFFVSMSTDLCTEETIRTFALAIFTFTLPTTKHMSM